LILQEIHSQLLLVISLPHIVNKGAIQINFAAESEIVKNQKSNYLTTEVSKLLGRGGNCILVKNRKICSYQYENSDVLRAVESVHKISDSSIFKSPTPTPTPTLTPTLTPS
jgi:hypothetical protein